MQIISTGVDWSLADEDLVPYCACNSEYLTVLRYVSGTFPFFMEALCTGSRATWLTFAYVMRSAFMMHLHRTTIDQSLVKSAGGSTDYPGGNGVNRDVHVLDNRVIAFALTSPTLATQFVCMVLRVKVFGTQRRDVSAKNIGDVGIARSET